MLNLVIDVPEQRVQQDRMSMLVTGWEWDLTLSLNVYVEPINKTAMLAPYCFSNAWSGSGDVVGSDSPIYRKHLTDYNVTWAPGASGDVLEHYIRDGNDMYLLCTGDAPIVVTKELYPINQPMYLSVFVKNVGNDNYELLNCGWGGNVGSGGQDLSLRFWSNGGVEVWRGTAKIGNTNYITTKKERQTDNNDGTPGAPENQLSQETIDIILVPYRRDELLIVTNKGAASVPFPEFDTDPTNPSPTVAASGSFWWYTPKGGQCSCATLKFPENGYLTSHPYTFRNVPSSSLIPITDTYYSNPGYGTQTVNSYLYLNTVVGASGYVDSYTDGVSGYTFVPLGYSTGDGRTGKIVTALTGDGNSTPFVYGAKSVFSTVTASTPGTGVSIQPLTMTYNMSNSPADTKLTFTFVGSSLDTYKLNTIGNRGVALYLDGNEVFRGRSGMPKKTKGRGLEPDIITYECQDYWGVFDKYLMSNPTPFDGISIYDAWTELVTMPGSCLTDIEPIDFPIPDISKASDGKWASLPDVGDTISTWILKLKEAFAGNWELGWMPTPAGQTFMAKPIATLNASAAVATLYPGVDSAITGGVAASAMNDLWFYNSYSEQRLPIESNEVWVMWRHPKTGSVNRVVDWDPVSIDPTVAVSGRPDNWYGEPLKTAFGFDPIIQSDYSAKYYARTLLNRLSSIRIIGEWSCNLLKKPNGMPVWRGDCVQLDGIGKFRVTSFSADFTKGRINTKYTGEKC